jgi:hypothetical protein
MVVNELPTYLEERRIVEILASKGRSINRREAAIVAINAVLFHQTHLALCSLLNGDHRQ